MRMLEKRAHRQHIQSGVKNKQINLKQQTTQLNVEFYENKTESTFWHKFYTLIRISNFKSQFLEMKMKLLNTASKSIRIFSADCVFLVV